MRCSVSPFSFPNVTFAVTVRLGSLSFLKVLNYDLSDSKLLSPMPASETIESIQSTLQPLGELQGEQTQLETWVHDSFDALEKLHGELSDWQTELARKQTELDLREDSLEKCREQEGDLETQVIQWKRDLDEAREEIQQLEEENTEQLKELENLERRHALLEAERNAASQRTEDLSLALEAERARTNQEQGQWAEEFQEIRQLLEQQCVLLEEHLDDDKLEIARDIEEAEPLTAVVEGEISSRSAELRRRAQMRRAAKRRRQRNTGESDQE